MAWANVDTKAQDGGWDQLCTIAKVHPMHKKALEDIGIEALVDFVNLYSTNDTDSEYYKKRLGEVYEDSRVKDSPDRRIQLSRLITAYEWAVLVKKESESKPNAVKSSEPVITHAESMDWELPLLVEEQKEMTEDWKKYGGFTISHRLYPAERLKNRMFREFRKWCMSVTVVSNMKTQALDNAPLIKHQTAIGPDVSIVQTSQRGYIPRDVVGYYWGLRVLMGAWGQAGNYLVDSVLKPGTKVKMMPLSEALDYADRFLQVVLSSSIPEEEQLAWGEQKDRLTRSIMASLVREDGGKYPASEALVLALARTATDWATVGGKQVLGVHQNIEEMDTGAECGMAYATAANAVPLGTPTPYIESFVDRVRQSKKKGGKGQGQGKGRGKGKGKGKDDKGKKEVKLGSMTPQLNGKKYCGNFNFKGCRHQEKDCPSYGLHQCAYRVSAGSVCGSRKHGFSGHGR